MIIEEKINGLLFQEQRTYRIYRSEEDRNKGNAVLTTSDENMFINNKELARQKEGIGDQQNKFFVFPDKREPSEGEVWRSEQGNKFVVNKDNISKAKTFVCSRPHEDGDFSYLCGFGYCRCCD